MDYRWLLTLGTVIMMMAGCTADDDAERLSAPMSPTLTVSELPWQQQGLAVTRAAETLTSLKSSGIGLYCEKLSMANRQVAWNVATQTWDFGSYPYYLPSGFTATDLLAYAPYNASAVVAGGLYTFAPAVDNSVDLMWGDSGGTPPALTLTFRHALAKVSFGTVSNHYGSTVTLQSVTLTDKPSQRLYESGCLDLSDGTWSDLSAYATEKVVSRTDFDADAVGSQPLSVADGDVVALGLEPMLFIPGPTVVVTVTINGDYGTETFSQELTLEQGVNKEVSITIAQNHQVEIE